MVLCSTEQYWMGIASESYSRWLCCVCRLSCSLNHLTKVHDEECNKDLQCRKQCSAVLVQKTAMQDDTGNPNQQMPRLLGAP